MKMRRELVERAWRLGINFSEFLQGKLKREAGEDEGGP
jgi:post-segregation antitoxin (ccd killing protein)